MTISFELQAEPRHDLGKGASRRLRRAGKVPAVMYGAGREVQHLTLSQNQLLRRLENEAFYSHVLQIQIGDQTEQAILKDLQRHPVKPAILHVDLQRVKSDEKIRVHVPLHFINAEVAPGVKTAGGAVSHLRIDVEVSCLPQDLPEFVDADLSHLNMGESLFLSDLQLPAGVELVELAHGSEADAPIASVHGQRAGEEAAEGGATPEAAA